MNYNVDTIPNFEREFKKLAKKHDSLKLDLLKLIDLLSSNPETGIDLGQVIYKIRLKISSKNKGKSAGARIITYLKRENKIVYLISIFDKKIRQNISKKEILTLLSKNNLL